MEISAEKTKLMTNSANGIQREIKVKGQKLGTVTSFKYLGAVVSDDGSKPEILSRIAQATAALTKLKPIWRDNNISLGSKVKLMRSLVISIFLYVCESWTLTAELEKRTQAFEMRCYRRLLNISYKDHVTNEEARRKIQAAIGEYDELLTLVKKRKLRWFGHVSRSSGLAKTILQGTVKGKRKRGRQKKRWEDNIKEWTGMDFASSTRAAENRSRWKVVVANSSVVPRRPSKVMGQNRIDYLTDWFACSANKNGNQNVENKQFGLKSFLMIVIISYFCIMDKFVKRYVTSEEALPRAWKLCPLPKSSPKRPVG